MLNWIVNFLNTNYGALTILISIATVYELRNFPKYYEVSIRILSGWINFKENKTQKNYNRLYDEMRLTISFMKKKFILKNLFKKSAYHEKFLIEQRNKGKERIRYDLNISFIAALVVLFGDFTGDYFKEEYQFKFYYFIKILLPLIVFFVIKLLLKPEKDTTNSKFPPTSQFPQ